MASRPALVKQPVKRPAKKPAPGPMVLDSSCWMEFFADTPRADLFAAVIEAHTAREAGDEVATAALSLMQRGKVVGVDLPLALEAAMNGLPLAESLIYATARHHGAELWTQDSHFEGLPGVRYFAKP